MKCTVKIIYLIPCSPGSWNHKDHGIFKVQQVDKLLETPAPLEKLKKTATVQMEDREKKSEKEEEEKKKKLEEEKKKKEEVKSDTLHGRSLEEVCSQ